MTIRMTVMTGSRDELKVIFYAISSDIKSHDCQAVSLEGRNCVKFPINHVQPRRLLLSEGCLRRLLLGQIVLNFVKKLSWKSTLQKVSSVLLLKHCFTRSGFDECGVI